MNKSILLVDDDEIHNYITELMLQEHFPGVEIIVHDRPTKAIEYLETNSPTLILLDINMREMSGFEFVEKYLELEYDKSKETNIIILSTSFYEKDMNKASSYEVISEYIVKPCKYSSLKSYI